MKKRIIISLAVIAAVAAVVSSGTLALFSDTETSNGNIFTAGAIDLKVDHTYASYNGEDCNGCVPAGPELLTNGGFENPEPAANGGQWEVFASIPGWTGIGAGIEIQEGGVAGAPHGGDQLVELDSHGLADSRSGMKQVFATTPGQKYRLTFWHSPRPDNGPNTDNAIELKVLVTSNSGTLLNEVIGQPSFNGGSTAWTPYTREFVALDSQTTIQFEDDGSEADTLGGYLDDVSVVMLNCPTDTYTNTPGGTCTLWAEKDLAPTDKFWQFSDVKPADWGKDTISLHVYSNDAYVCLMPRDVQDLENVLVEPEVTAGDVTNDPTPGAGELAEELQFFMWQDNDADNSYDLGEPIVVPVGTAFNAIATSQLALSSPAPATLVGVEWCAGDQTMVDGIDADTDADDVSCNGNGMGDKVQTDKVVADFVAYAVQQRNNSGFTCAQLELSPR